MISSLNDKKILFICPIFYNYHQLIQTKLIESGAEVIFVPEREYSIKFSIVNNFFPFYLEQLQQNYFNTIQNSIENKTFDYLFVIRGFKLPEKFLNYLKIRNPMIKLIMYQWDSNANNPYFDSIKKYDKVFSFDYLDCNLNNNVINLPLFYTDDIHELQVNQSKIKIEYDYFFFGSFNPAPALN